MMICKKCKAEMPDDTYFCEKCGELMYGQDGEAADVKSEGKYCHSCGDKLSPAAVFCPKCGTKQEPGNALAAPGMNDAPQPQLAPAAFADSSNNKLGEFNVSINSVSSIRKLIGVTNMGKLSVFNNRLEFKPGALNVFDTVITIPASEITAVNIVSVYGFQNGVQVVLRSGQEHIFIPTVWERDRLIELIRSQLSG
ncbi:MAG: zinc ribbon domain-containing protein [Oscillospiraceae bacterium]|nr:zinc ribbon domain-containing protein [Oscillospiraceae bacterium]